ncbi:alcohol-forming fatty acyl-CoA reductase-like [Gossypium australe]|uniref:Alcohol-forming fatty acyl-CoA reductase-like n=1 Tax=Gossypium australe TaxID=47621 RepID=A0A5B6VDH7_9ROSI|nr:alcohol-forming fatty acyl-CoA reductase-like [Gossypium australe]
MVDMTFGTDCLVEHRVNLDYAAKRVTLRTDENGEVIMVDYLSNVISALLADKVVRKGCQTYLAFVFDFIPAKLSIRYIRTVRDFPNVFPEELPEINPDREVEFGIDLLPGTAPVSIAPYRMALKEFVELKAQL